MSIPPGLHSLSVIMLIAVCTPLIVARLPGPKIPGVVLLLIFRRRSPGTESLRMAFHQATGLPLIVAICAVGLQTGVMRSENAGALVGAGLLTVMIRPMTARWLPHRTAAGALDTADAVPANE
jgi:Kef-type K+ transport system membrane component KefB